MYAKYHFVLKFIGIVSPMRAKHEKMSMFFFSITYYFDIHSSCVYYPQLNKMTLVFVENSWHSRSSDNLFNATIFVPDMQTQSQSRNILH